MSSLVRTLPVGLLGLLQQIALVFGVRAASSFSLTAHAYPSSAVVGTGLITATVSHPKEI